LNLHHVAPQPVAIFEIKILPLNDRIKSPTNDQRATTIADVGAPMNRHGEGQTAASLSLH
jgi:hypothetical protein